MQTIAMIPDICHAITDLNAIATKKLKIKGLDTPCQNLVQVDSAIAELQSKLPPPPYDKQSKRSGLQVAVDGLKMLSATAANHILKCVSDDLDATVTNFTENSKHEDTDLAVAVKKAGASLNVIKRSNLADLTQKPQMKALFKRWEHWKATRGVLAAVNTHLGGDKMKHWATAEQNICTLLPEVKLRVATCIAVSAACRKVEANETRAVLVEVAVDLIAEFEGGVTLADEVTRLLKL